MSCQYHPGAETLLKYASGAIGGLHNVMLKLHCDVCPSCASHVAELEGIGGQYLNKLEGLPLTENAFEQLMSRIESEEINMSDNAASNSDNLIDSTKIPSATNTPVANEYLDILQQILLKGSSKGLNWHWRTKRFAEIPLPTNDDSFDGKLIYFKKGMKVPQHTHRDKEYTLVLSGAFSDDKGTYRRGDYVSNSRLDEHAPIAESDCICFAVTTEPLKFTGTFGPVLNWFFN
jgi:putative transcriptional regulator